MNNAGAAAYHAYGNGTLPPERKASAMRKGIPTRYPGVYAVDKNQFRVRVKLIDPRTGQSKEVAKQIVAASAAEAAAMRLQLAKSIEERNTAADMKVGAFARLWLESKAAVVDRYSADGYTSALENQVLPGLGQFFYRALRPADVQAWVNKRLAEKKTDGSRKYAVRSVHNWFRVLRNMTRDAIVQLDLPRDPTSRITFPEGDPREGNNALTPEDLSRFLDEMRVRYPSNYALTATLAFTGLRFCHASALRWEDIDEEAGELRIRRKQKRGNVGPVSRRKRAPREIPLAPELAAILREHRRRLLEKLAAGFDPGWCFPSDTGTMKHTGSLDKAWKKCCAAAGIKGRFTIHGLRRTFNDLARRAGVDAVVTKSITGHVTEQMREHYSTVRIDEKRQAIAGVLRLVPLNDCEVGPKVGPEPSKQNAS